MPIPRRRALGLALAVAAAARASADPAVKAELPEFSVIYERSHLPYYGVGLPQDALGLVNGVGLGEHFPEFRWFVPPDVRDAVAFHLALEHGAWFGLPLKRAARAQNEAAQERRKALVKQAVRDVRGEVAAWKNGIRRAAQVLARKAVRSLDRTNSPSAMQADAEQLNGLGEEIARVARLYPGLLPAQDAGELFEEIARAKEEVAEAVADRAGAETARRFFAFVRSGRSAEELFPADARGETGARAVPDVRDARRLRPAAKSGTTHFDVIRTKKAETPFPRDGRHRYQDAFEIRLHDAADAEEVLLALLQAFYDQTQPLAGRTAPPPSHRPNFSAFLKKDRDGTVVGLSASIVDGKPVNLEVAEQNGRYYVLPARFLAGYTRTHSPTPQWDSETALLQGLRGAYRALGGRDETFQIFDYGEYYPGPSVRRSEFELRRLSQSIAREEGSLSPKGLFLSAAVGLLAALAAMAAAAVLLSPVAISWETYGRSIAALAAAAFMVGAAVMGYNNQRWFIPQELEKLRERNDRQGMSARDDSYGDVPLIGPADAAPPRRAALREFLQGALGLEAREEFAAALRADPELRAAVRRAREDGLARPWPAADVRARLLAALARLSRPDRSRGLYEDVRSQLENILAVDAYGVEDIAAAALAEIEAVLQDPAKELDALALSAYRRIVLRLAKNRTLVPSADRTLGPSPHLARGAD
ncbi:MAG: hypothetical protein HY552_02355 [Elusimicrobia bacterium]|nr:hypothetical protein [Elusimicrobiota bacterium]